jgi:hypothetical protein
MRYSLLVGLLLLSPASSTLAQVSFQFDLPSVSIGINQPVFPQLVLVPGYPVYYDPNASSNYFFYDGVYWVYAGDTWYASDWYNGPWARVAPQDVPMFVLRVPVRYYRSPPSYFRGWHRDAPPRWGEHWGNDWERSHAGWDRWHRNEAPRPAPLPVYQRQYSGNRYPPPQQQRALHGENYRHEPRDPAVRQVLQPQQHDRGGWPGSREAPSPQPTRGRQNEGHQGAGGAPEPRRDANPPREGGRGSEHEHER